MPEGPEVAREADRIRRALEGQRVEEVEFAFAALQHQAGRFRGRRVRSVRSRGKALLIGFSNGLTIYSHNQLYGRWYVRGAGSWPRTQRQLRLAIRTRARWALLYSASEIEVLDARGLERHRYLASLGPDALDPDLDVETLAARLEDPRFARRGLAALLLDQSFVAGIGNYLRSEICFEARVDPARRPIDLGAAERRRLARAIQTLTRRAYRTRGVTLPVAQARPLRAAGVSWRAARHWVFDRQGEACRRCGSSIERRTQASRRIYVCTRCQPQSP
ncbi:MAG: endonuclease VIII [Deltaproteobacteria bacterium]|jgi:endonuclease-8|nr:endonuclease VIII [Deltaproteobacteria bacterium]